MHKRTHEHTVLSSKVQARVKIPTFVMWYEKLTTLKVVENCEKYGFIALYEHLSHELLKLEL